MARGVRERLGADVAVVGDRDRRPGRRDRRRSRSGSSTSTRRGPTASAAWTSSFPGDRETVRARAAAAALHLVRALVTEVVHEDTSRLRPLAWAGDERLRLFCALRLRAEPSTRSSPGSAPSSRRGDAGSSRPRTCTSRWRSSATGRPGDVEAIGGGAPRGRGGRAEPDRAPAPRLPRDAQRRDAHLRRRGRPGARRLRRRSARAARGARASTSREQRPWLPHVTVLRFREPAAPRPDAAGRSARSVRPTPLFTFPGCGPAGRSTRFSKPLR